MRFILGCWLAALLLGTAVASSALAAPDEVNERIGVLNTSRNEARKALDARDVEGLARAWRTAADAANALVKLDPQDGRFPPIAEECTRFAACATVLRDAAAGKVAAEAALAHVPAIEVQTLAESAPAFSLPRLDVPRLFTLDELTQAIQRGQQRRVGHVAHHQVDFAARREHAVHQLSGGIVEVPEDVVPRLHDEPSVVRIDGDSDQRVIIVDQRVLLDEGIALPRIE